MNRYWMSWIVKDSDFRPLTFPPNVAILGWWCSGYNEDAEAILCGLIQAETQDAAKVAVLSDWPDVAWRFVEDRDPNYVVKSDRFPLMVWMVDRIVPGGAE